MSEIPSGFKVPLGFGDSGIKFRPQDQEKEKTQEDVDIQNLKDTFGDTIKSNYNQLKVASLDGSEEFLHAAVERAIELDDREDDEVAILHHERGGAAGNRFTSETFGTSEFVLETLGTKCTPTNIDILELVGKTIPNSDFAKYENMRIDAYRIEGVLVQSRGFLHDNMPEAHRLIEAMVDYYDSRDEGEDAITQKKQNLVDLINYLNETHGGNYSELNPDLILNLANYDKMTEPHTYDRIGGFDKEHAEKIYEGSSTEESAIDVLRRIEANIRPTPIEAPETKIPELNAAFERLGQIQVNERTGEFMVDVDELGDVLSAINNHLIENSGKRELYPSTITAITYIDKMAATALRRISKKEWAELAFDPNFKEMLRFAQLTMSGGYSEYEFDATSDRLTYEASKAFGGDQVDYNAVQNAYSFVSNRALRNAKAIADEMKRHKSTENLTSAIWSGNLTHELIGLAEKYPS